VRRQVGVEGDKRKARRVKKENHHQGECQNECQNALVGFEEGQRQQSH